MLKIYLSLLQQAWPSILKTFPFGLNLFLRLTSQRDGLKVGKSAYFRDHKCQYVTGLEIRIPKMNSITIKMSSSLKQFETGFKTIIFSSQTIQNVIFPEKD